MRDQTLTSDYEKALIRAVQLVDITSTGHSRTGEFATGSMAFSIKFTPTVCINGGEHPLNLLGFRGAELRIEWQKRDGGG
jgi:hypothetical protein